MQTVVPSHLWLVEFAEVNPGIGNADCIFIEKYLHLSGPAQFKPILFKCQLCFVLKDQVHSDLK